MSGWRLLGAVLLALLWFGHAEDANQAPPGTSSLTFVFDITGSMFDDLQQVREGAKKIFQTVMSQRQRLIYNYILVPFHDPELGEIINTTDSLYFQRQLGKVHVYGGGDCPEMTLTGIKKALDISLPSSFIYVFTDARSKDYHLEDDVLNLIQEKQSSVVFVMTGDCGNRTHPGFRTYEKIAAASFGQVFHLQKSDVSAVLEYVRYAVKQKKVHLSYEVRDRGGTTVRKVPVDKHMTELTLSLSGDKDDEDFLDITLRNPKGQLVDKNAYNKEGGTIDLKNVKLIRLKDPMPGNWEVTTLSRLKHTLRVFGHGTIDFKYGFGARPLERIELARPRPVENQNTYLMVNMTGLIPPGTPVEISLIDYFGNTMYTHPASPAKTNPHMYFVGPFVPPKGLFFVQVKGVDDEDYEFQRIAPTAIGSVSVGGPRAYMADRTTAFATQAVNLSCTVESQTPYQIFWKRGDTILGGPLFYYRTDTAVWTLPEVAQRDRGEYQCHVVSQNGNHTARTFLETREAPPHIINMRNESVAIGQPAYLHCQTQSLTKADIRWLRHGQPIGNGLNTRIYPNGTLLIWRTSRSDAGGYECQARNSGGLSTQGMMLKVLELPVATVTPNSLHFVPFTAFNISCFVSGDPPPIAHWFYNGRPIVVGDKYYITYKNELVVRSTSIADAGVYECRAVNQAGTHSDTARVESAVVPKLDLKQSKTMIGRGDTISFDCIILEGTPSPKITWFRNGRELLPSSDEYIKINNNQLHIKGVQDTDAGSYSCVAENMAGREMKSVKVAVGSMPSIVPSPETVRVNIERQVTLQCRAIGHPLPAITWQREGVDIDQLYIPRYTVLPDGNLLIEYAQLEDQARFTCKAQNDYGQQSKTTMVVVTGLVSPVLGQVPPEEQMLENEDLRLSCVVVLGTPKPIIQWFKDGEPLVMSHTRIIEGGGSSILLRNGNPTDEGRYTCAAISPAGNATLNINVTLIKKPTIGGGKLAPAEAINPHVIRPVEWMINEPIKTETDPISIKDGNPVDLTCEASGMPPPVISWSLDGRTISKNNKDYEILENNTLRILNADKTKAGKYVCMAANSGGYAEQATILSVISTPVIQPGQTSFNLIQGSDMVIPCDVQGEPMPNIKWYLNDKMVTEGFVDEDGALHIEEANDIHKGQLKCVAENEAGVDERIVTLTVHTAPIIDGSEQTQTIIATVNETVTLPCPAQAFPPPDRVWSYEGERIPNHEEDFYGARIDVLDDGALEVAEVQLHHSGQYYCHVSNLAGEDSITYQLKVNEPPKIISETPGVFDVVHGMTLEIPCKSVGTPTPTVTWEKDGFQLIPNAETSVDLSGTLRVHNAQLENAGEYKCSATNPSGTTSKSTTVVVQEPPAILPTTIGAYTVVEGDKVELRCHVSASPAPSIIWTRKGIPVEEGPGVKVLDDGTLVIDEVSKSDAAFYSCKASNPAGTTEKIIQVSVIVAPEIPDQDIVSNEVVRLNNSFSLYCPVFSTPLPQISWHLDDNPIVDDENILFSDDQRRLHFAKARIRDAGVYKCIARNAAGESSKSFDVEVVVPVNIDESLFKRKVSAQEGSPIEIGCPVSGTPDPLINWVVQGRIIDNKEPDNSGIRLGADGRTIIIDSTQLHHEGNYHCVAQNKAGSLDVEVSLDVLAPPKLGKDETVEVLKGRAATLNCDVRGEEEDKSRIAWSKKGSSDMPTNVQIPFDAQRAYLMDVTTNNSGIYTCHVTNSAGTSSKTFNVTVIEAPLFTETQTDQNVRIIAGAPLQLSCLVTGHPQPEVIWSRDDVVIEDQITSDNGQTLTIQYDDVSQSRYSCAATNKAGTITRDFFVQSVAPPELDDSGDRTIIEVMEGETAPLICVAKGNGQYDIQWRKQGRTVMENEAHLSADRSQLVIVNAKREHDDVYTCIAKNDAGEAAREFQVIVLSPPRIRGPLVEDIEVVEGDEMTLECDFDGTPNPLVGWSKDGEKVPQRAQMLNENRTLAMNAVEIGQAGVYKCGIENKAGHAVKTFNVHVIEKPQVSEAEAIENVEVILGRPYTFECPVNYPVGIEFSWTRHELPVTSGMENVQVMADGRHLHIVSANLGDEGTYVCIAKNRAGESQKKFRLKVLVLPKIINAGGEITVIENNSLVLPCEVEGEPSPKITWNKDGKPITNLGNTVRIFNDGQQFKITRADAKHKGLYACHASNKIGSAEISFDVDIITKPTVAHGIKDTIEVIEGETALVKCPVEDKNFKGEITWLQNHKPIKMDSDHFTTSQGNKKLHIHGTTLRDEGGYSCRIKNDAGETRVEFKLVVLVPPSIVMLDKDKNRTVVENKTVTISCPATGKPEPNILWFKDGVPLHESNISKIVQSAQIIKHEIKISRVNAKDSGRFTCEAKNKAGSAEQDVSLFVMTPPKIEREGIDSDIEEVADRTVTLSCPVYGKPTPKVTWLKNGKPLNEEQRIKTSANSQKLYFLKLSKAETDKYTCIASNPAGEDKRDFNVKLLEAPSFDAPNIVHRVQVNEGRTSVLMCPAIGSPPPAITWLRDGVTLSPGPRHVFLDNGKKLQISKTTAEDHARYTCIATNSVGSDDLETTLDVVSIPVINGEKHEKLEVIENNRKDLVCEVNETDSSVEIEWQKAGQTIGVEELKSNTFLQIPSSGRRLHILSSRVSDAGRYTCVVRNPAGEARKTFELKVLVPPTINEATSSQDIQTVIPGALVTVECDVDGNPTPEIEWRHNDQPIDVLEGLRILNNNKTIQIESVGESAGGRFSCKAKNRAGEAARDFIVKLTGPPVFDQGHEKLDVAVDDSITLTCKIISGTGGVTVNWLVNGKPVQNGELSSSVQIEDRQVKITDVRLSDAGQYVCVAKNEGGEARKTFDLSVLEPPRFLDMTNQNPSIVVGRPLTLDCSVSGIPKPSIIWMKNGDKMNISALDPERYIFMNDKQQLHIEEATPDEAGRYSCVAENRQGRAEKDLTVEILKPPKMTENYLPREVMENQPITLHCPIQDPTTELIWTKHGIPITTSQKLQTSVNRDKLFVMNAETSDTAQFGCIAKNEAGEDTATFNLTVLVAPKIQSPSFRTIDAVYNQTVQITCQTTGVPPPTIQWHFDGRELFGRVNTEVSDDGKILTLHSVEEEDAGRYSCKAENKVGKAEADAFLAVTVPPRVAMTSDEMKVIAGHGVTIRCEVFGDPQPDVHWQKNGQPFKSELLQTSTNLKYLHIRSATIEDAGRYTCVGTNRAGEQRSSTQLHVLVAPTIEDGERVLQVKEGKNLTIDCPASGTPTPTIFWKRDGEIVPEANSTKFAIVVANASDAGRYTCSARNEAGTATADFAVDVLIKPKFKEGKQLVKVVDGARARLECKVEGHPVPAITWLKGGRPIEDMSNLILSPRGETLMIVKARRSDAGSYSCVAKNAAGEAENPFTVDVLTPPHIDETIDQNPKMVQGKELVLNCPVLGNPDPTVEWRRNGEPLPIGGRFSLVDKKHLHIEEVSKDDENRYTCHATNEAGELDTTFLAEVIAKPKFARKGESSYDVLDGEPVTMDCAVAAGADTEVVWYRGESALYLTDMMELSPDGMKLHIRSTNVNDGGKYVCNATNEAGSTEIDLILRILLPPKIDRSNIIGNPLAIVDKTIYLECPASGIPQPDVLWLKDGQPINETDERIRYHQNNQTFGIEGVQTSDQARYTCVASNKGGVMEQDFNLEVLTPPTLETTETQKIAKREEDPLALICPVRSNLDGTGQADVSWIKDGRPLDPTNDKHIKFSSDNRRLQIASTNLGDAGHYTCVALNRAGESTLEFEVEILSPPVIDASRNDQNPRVTVGNPVTIWCPVTGHPFPTIKWTKDGNDVTASDNVRILDNGQGIELFSARREDKGRWTCSAENDAGSQDLDINLDVWVPPNVRVTSDDPIKALGQSIILICHAEGNPTPSVVWNKGGQPLITEALSARVSLKGTRLDIPRLEITDVGDYTCVAENEAGTASASIHVDVLVPPEITRDNVDMSPRLPTGQTLTLLCESQGKPQPELKWYVNETEITTETDGVFMGHDSKFIQINNISLEDRGVYRCIALNVAGNDTLLYNVDVVQAPAITNGGTQQVIEGEVASIECEASGHPLPLVSWLRNGVRLETGLQGVRYMADGKILKVIDSRSSDSGIYVCAATNEAGTAQQAYTLEVLVSPVITSTSANESTVPVGQPFSLKCGVKGYPEPEIQWFLNDVLIKSGESGSTVAEDGTLFVESAKGRNLNYRCLVKNNAGTDEIEYLVKTISAPVVTKEGLRTVNATEEEPTALTCDIEGDTPSIAWYKNGNLLPTSSAITYNEDKTVLTIASSKLNDDGEYSCVAVNSAGNATQKIQLYVGVPPRITDKPRRVVVKQGQQAELWCEAVGVPQPHIVWMRDNVPLTHTAVDANSDRRKTSALFKSITPDQAGVYTCKAENWAGTSYKDVDLVVLIPPSVMPEKMNVSTNPRETAILPCNASGIPEPVVSWVKVPNTEIVANEKYQLLGTSLAIRNVLPEDDGFYHCVAKSEAGQALGSRKLVVMQPEKEQKVIWVECDEDGRPIKTTYMPSRGDVPDDDNNLLPWKETHDMSVNGTNGITIRCLPGPRAPRAPFPGLNAAPRFVHTPKPAGLYIGKEISLSCSAEGPPVPEIYWSFNGEVLKVPKPKSGHSKLVVRMITPNQAGNYTCHAKNSVGESSYLAEVTYIEPEEDEVQYDYPEYGPGTEPLPNERHVAVLNCQDRQNSVSTGVTWVHGDRPVDPKTEPVILMNNGSLVVLDSDSLPKDELAKYTCRIRGRRKQNTIKKMLIEDAPPRIAIPPSKVHVEKSLPATIDCILEEGQPLTTEIKWTKNNEHIVPDENVFILPNNSLYIVEADDMDAGEYRCHAVNSLGKSYDNVPVIVEGRGTGGLVGFVEDAEKSSATNQALQILLNNPWDTLEPNRVREALEPILNTTIDDFMPDNGIPSYVKESELRFGDGEKVRMFKKVNKRDPMHPEQTSFQGNFPKAFDDDEIVLEKVKTTIRENIPGQFFASGDAILRIGNQTYNVHVIDQYTFQSLAHKINPGHSIRLELSQLVGENQENPEKKLFPQDNCGDGFETADDGTCIDIDECSNNGTLCGKAAECENTEGGYECKEYVCLDGYRLQLDGFCRDIDECESNPCNEEEYCVNTAGSYSCMVDNPCGDGFRLNRAKDVCEDVNECLNTPCAEGLDCVNQLGSYVCLCPNGHPPMSGGTCSTSRYKTHHVTTTRSHKCEHGYHWDGDTCADIDECSLDMPCQWKCENTQGAYVCLCPEGYRLNEFKKCVDENECEHDKNVCNGTGGAELCFNHFGGYECLDDPCPKDYHLIGNHECHHDCHDCHHPVIQLHLLPLTAGLPPGTHLARLTAYDKQSKVVNDTIYTITNVADMQENSGRTNSGPFSVKSEHGRAIIMSSKPMPTNQTTELRVFAVSETEEDSNYLLLVNVGKYPF